MQFTTPEMWKWHALLFDIHTRSSNMNISKWLGANHRTVEEDSKRVWRSPMVIMKVRQLGIFTLIILIIEFLNLFGEIKTMIGNDPRKSIRLIARDMGVSEFHIRQVVHEDIRYFSYKIRKGQFFITGNEGQEERQCSKVFQQTQTFPPT